MKRFLLLLGAILFATSATSFAAVNYSVNTGNNVNCTTSEGQTGFDIQSFTIGGMDNVNIGAATGAGAGKPKLADLVVTKVFDACSEPLIKQFLLGSVIPTVTLTGVKSGGETERPMTILTITLSNARIDNWQMSGSGEIPMESISFAYSQVCIAYTPLSVAGVAGKPITVCYNAATSKVQ